MYVSFCRWSRSLERPAGVEPALPPWRGSRLPLHHGRKSTCRIVKDRRALHPAKHWAGVEPALPRYEGGVVATGPPVRCFQSNKKARRRVTPGLVSSFLSGRYHKWRGYVGREFAGWPANWPIHERSHAPLPERGAGLSRKKDIEVWLPLFGPRLTTGCSSLIRVLTQDNCEGSAKIFRGHGLASAALQEVPIATMLMASGQNAADRMPMTSVPETVDKYQAWLHQDGWSTGDTAILTPTGMVWMAHRGEQRIVAKDSVCKGLAGAGAECLAAFRRVDATEADLVLDAVGAHCQRAAVGDPDDFAFEDLGRLRCLSVSCQDCYENRTEPVRCVHISDSSYSLLGARE
jgi:hypothetical protein